MNPQALLLLQAGVPFVGALLFAFAGAASLFWLAGNFLSVAYGDGMNRGAGGEDGPFWTWPRDRLKIASYALAVGAAGVASFVLSSVLAHRAFYGA